MLGWVFSSIMVGLWCAGLNHKFGISMINEINFMLGLYIPTPGQYRTGRVNSDKGLWL